MYIFPRHPLIAHHPKQLTLEWAQHVINQQVPGATAQQVKLISIDIGTTTRIRIKVIHNGPKTLPQVWFVKIPSLSWRARAITALPRLLHTETRFYNELALHTPVNKPYLLSAKSLFGRGSTLVMNDLSEQHYIPGKPGDTLSKHQALQVIDLLAGLHSPFWNKTQNNPHYKWLSGPIRQLEDHLGTALAVPLMKRGLNKAGSLVPKALHEPAIHYARHRRSAMKFLSQGAQTITHHDCHPGNLFWNKTIPGLLDWQMVRTGEGISDISYFLATSLQPSIRRTSETQLIRHYIQNLTEKGVAGIDFKQIHKRYRAHLIYPFEAMLITLAVGGMMDLDANLQLIERAATSVADNNAFDILPQ